ncbi:alpha-galactosidase [Streptomyces sp. 846.5]|nr:alpha-galactosidase [Streptomyces sp. 846.5]
MTTSELPSAPATPLLDDLTVAVLADGRPVGHLARELPDGLVELQIDAEPGTALEIRLATPLRDAVGYWHPGSGWERTLLPDWAGRARTSLVMGAAVGCLYETSGATLLAFAALDPVAETRIVFGVSEQAKLFVVHLRLTAGTDPYRLVLAPRAATPATALRRLRTRLAAHAPVPPLPTPEAAHRPVYSTWYALGQDVTADTVAAEAARAAALGCRLLILDDGWQQGGTRRGYDWAGDWTADTAKFPDLAAHVRQLRATGMSALAWIAPLLIGPGSRAWHAFGGHAPIASPTAPGARVLDPRVPAVRRHLVAVCTRLLSEYGFDGLKVDFLDDAMVYSGDGGPDVGRAMARLLGELRTALEAVRPGGELMVELRQPYLGHGMAAYGNLARATDCPADAVANRVRTVDAGLLSLGGAVHSDMLMWDPAGTPEAAARQLLAVLHAVPQISCRLDELRPDHAQALAFWLRQWERLRPVLVEGELEPGRPDELYPLVSAHRGEHHAVVVHADRVVPVRPGRFRHTDVVNATPGGRLVLDVLSDTGPVTLRQTVHDTLGRMISTRECPLGPGPVAVAVPPSGLVTLRTID